MSLTYTVEPEHLQKHNGTAVHVIQQLWNFLVGNMLDAHKGPCV